MNDCENCTKLANGKNVWLKNDGKSCFDCGKEVLKQYQFFGSRTLRDEFAMAVLKNSKYQFWGLNESEMIDVASGVYRMADAMLRARK